MKGNKKMENENLGLTLGVHNVVIDKAELEVAISESVKSVVKELKLDEISRVNISSANTKWESPAYSFHKLLCSIRKGDNAGIREVYEKAADPMTVGVSSDGGYLVPALTENKILELIPTFSQARQHMMVMPITGNVINIPKELALPTISWVGENVSITSSKPTLSTIQLTPKKAAGLVALSNELLQNANVNIGNYIIKKLAQAFGTSEDTQMFAGTGSPFTGVFNNSHTFGNAVTTSTTNPNSLTYNNIIDCTYGVDANYLAGAKWFMHRSIMGLVRKILDSQNRPIFVDANGSTPATMLGYPVVLVENAPNSSTAANKVFIVLGNLENSIIGDISSLSVTLLTEATIDGTSLAQSDLSAIRVIRRVAFNAGLTGLYSIIRTAAII